MTEAGIGEGLSQGRGVEIHHFENFDAIVNTDAQNQTRVAGLLDIVKNGMPSAWQNIYSNMQRPIYQDRQINPQYIAKVRQIASPQFKNPEVQDWYNYWDAEERIRLLAENSLLNEIKLSPKVKAILNTEEAQRIVQEHGFNSVSFVEPLVGLINRNTGEKIMFYNFQSGYGEREGMNDDLDSLSHPLVILTDLDNYEIPANLKTLFQRHNIIAPDLGYGNFIARENDDGKIDLYLIDIAAYVEQRRISNPPTSTG